jgi:glycosidase
MKCNGRGWSRPAFLQAGKKGEIMRDVILHAFNWPLAKVADNAAAIAANGFGAVLLPPPLYSDQNGPDWWQRYQPKDYRVIRSYLGGKEQLERTIWPCTMLMFASMLMWKQPHG